MERLTTPIGCIGECAEEQRDMIMLIWIFEIEHNLDKGEEGLSTSALKIRLCGEMHFVCAGHEGLRGEQGCASSICIRDAFCE